MEYNWIQREVLKSLTTAEQLPYSKLRPASVDANLFSHHLKRLNSDNLIESYTKGIYTLTANGKQYVGSITIDTGKQRKQPKICVMLYATNSKGELLLYRWKRQPYYNMVSLPYGKTHFEKTLEECVLHEADMKLGIPVKITSYLGSFYQKITQSNITISHMLIHVYGVGIDETMELKSKQSGDSFWGNPDTLNKQFVPGFVEILDTIQTLGPTTIKEIQSNL